MIVSYLVSMLGGGWSDEQEEAVTWGQLKPLLFFHNDQNTKRSSKKSTIANTVPEEIICFFFLKIIMKNTPSRNHNEITK